MGELVKDDTLGTRDDRTRMAVVYTRRAIVAAFALPA